MEILNDRLIIFQA